MEQPNLSHELKTEFQLVVEPPICELMYDTKNNWLCECQGPDLIEQIKSRQRISNSITSLFDKISTPTLSISEAILAHEITEIQAVDLYDSLSEILMNDEYKRLALYLPTEIIINELSKCTSVILINSLEQFKNVYLTAWYDLLNTQDMRANFVDGDVLESEARSCDPPRVVKAAHLIPWLVSGGVIKVCEVLRLMNIGDHVLQRSIADTLPILDSMGLLTDVERQEFFMIKESLMDEPLRSPLFMSNSRKEWLNSKVDNTCIRPSKDINKDLLPSLSGPFNDNLQKMAKEVDDIKDRLSLIARNDEIYPLVIIGGSQIKGYGSAESDVDICIFVKSYISKNNEFLLDEIFKDYSLNKIRLDDNDRLIDAKEDWAHEIFNSAWIGSGKHVSDLQQKLAMEYYCEQDLSIRSRCIERLEQDLLQYRLMHKGYDLHYPSYNDRLPNDDEIGGQSAFYDSGYRQIATKLYIDKVFIPKIK